MTRRSPSVSASERSPNAPLLHDRERRGVGWRPHPRPRPGLRAPEAEEANRRESLWAAPHPHASDSSAVFPDGDGEGILPVIVALVHGPQDRSRGAEGAERSELALDGSEDRGSAPTTTAGEPFFFLRLF